MRRESEERDGREGGEREGEGGINNVVEKIERKLFLTLYHVLSLCLLD